LKKRTTKKTTEAQERYRIALRMMGDQTQRKSRRRKEFSEQAQRGESKRDKISHLSKSANKQQTNEDEGITKATGELLLRGGSVIKKGCRGR